jgi:hypothetical protein
VKTVSDNVVLAYLFIGIYFLWKVNVKFCYDKLYHLLFLGDFNRGNIRGRAKRQINQNVC